MKFAYALSDVFGFYLPKRLRRWFIFIPLNLLGIGFLLLTLLCIRASFITADPFFQNNKTNDTELQLKHLSELVEQSSESGKVDLTKGYSSICGYSTEWVPIFYTFYSMSLYEWSKTHPEKQDFLKSQLTICSRNILRVPPEIKDAELGTFFKNRKYGNSAVYDGYVGVVLGIRKVLCNDNSFDLPLSQIIHFLAAHLESDLDHCSEAWTADHATQLYAIWLADQHIHQNHQDLFLKWQKVMTDRFLDKSTGLLQSDIAIGPDHILSQPRGSSIGWTAIFLAEVLPEFARDQYRGLCKHREKHFLNFAASEEFYSGHFIQFGDTDSGPLLLGLSPSASGFTFCTHKIFGNKKGFERALRVFELFGSPLRDKNKKFYYYGNAMGDSILLYGKLVQPVKRLN